MGTITGNINLPSTSIPSTTRLRVRVSSSVTSSCTAIANGETEDYAITITPFQCSGTPVAGTAQGGPLTVCVGDSITLTCGGNYIGLTIQWQSSAAGANNFSNIPGATTDLLRTAQSVSTDYRLLVTCPNSGISTPSNIVSVYTPLLCYCSPTGANCANSYYISRIILGTIDNTSTCGSNGYSDFTTSVAPATINAGTFIPITMITPIPESSYRAVWIDYNHDGYFDASEYTNLGYGGSTAVVNRQLYISTVAFPGLTRIRFKRSTVVFGASDACVNSGSGEVEDYNININPAPISFYFTPFADTLYSHIINLTVRIVQHNVGLNMSDSLKPRVWTKSQYASTWTSFQGQLISGNSNDGVWQFPVKHDSIGIRVNGCDSVQYYFVAQDLNTPFNLGYYPELGITHTNVLDQDTVTAFFGYRLVPRLRDTIYINGYDCHYNSLTRDGGLFKDILNKKLEGDLTILIENDLTENGTYGITGAGLNGHKLFIRPASNTIRTLRTNLNFTNGSLFWLDGAKNVVFDGSYNGTGRYLRLMNQDYSVYGADTVSLIKIFNSCDSITIRNLQLYHVSDVGNGFENGIFLAHGTNKNILIEGNLFYGTDAGALPEIHLVSLHGNNQAIVSRNEFKDFKNAGVIMLTPCSNWKIDSNHFYKTLQPLYFSTPCSPITVRGNGNIISNNFIGGQSTFCSGQPMKLNNGNPFAGISVADSSGAAPNIILNNRINNIEMGLPGQSSYGGFAGISTANNCLITGNIIGDPLLDSGTYSLKLMVTRITGIGAAGSRPVEVRNNVIAGITTVTGVMFSSSDIKGIGWSNTVPPGFTAFNASAIISGNTIFNLQNVQNNVTVGISADGGSFTMVEKNLIHDLWASAGGVTGIAFVNAMGATPSIIQRNRIYNLINTSNTLGSCCDEQDDAYNGSITGIDINYERTGIDIINNQISITNAYITNPVTIRGIYEEYSGLSNPVPKQRILYNTIYIGGYANHYGGSTGFMSLYLPVKEVYNNIFYNDRTGGTKGHFAYRFPANNAVTLLTGTRSNNDLYVVQDSTRFAEWMYFYPHIDWTTWKINTASDDSSYMLPPATIPSSDLFVDKDHGNLNINFNNPVCWFANNKGKPYSFINSDFDSLDMRPTSLSEGQSDIGSDEFSTTAAIPVRICPGSGITFSSSQTGSSYQWQVNTGTGFSNIADNANYTGSATASLYIGNVPLSWFNYQYRCVVDGSSGEIYSVKFLNAWTGTLNSAWENSGNWSCGLLPDSTTDVVIASGNITLSSDVTIRSLTLSSGATLNILPGHTLTVLH